MKDKLQPLVGRISISDINKKTLYEKSNAIQPYALTALINLLAGNIDFNPKLIKVWQGGINVATSDLEGYLLDTPGHWVKLTAFFDAVSFTGDINELTLECLAGVFAEATGISFTKTSAQAIYITWQITVS